MLIEKEIVAPGCYWYVDESSGLPKKLDVTPDLCKHWHDQGSKMLASGLSIPVPFEHDFSSHPMTPRDKLLNNGGWVKEYRLKEGNKLFGVLDIQDEDIAKKLPRTIRWTSPWINSFTDGSGKQWNNVISHLALTTRPRITRQAPFGSVAAALSMATPSVVSIGGTSTTRPPASENFCNSRAGRLVVRKKTGRLQPQYPMAFSLISGGIKFAEDEDEKKMPPLDDKGGEKEALDEEETETKEGEPPQEIAAEDAAGLEGDGEEDTGLEGLMNPLEDSQSDVRMEEILCDLLQALGVPMPDDSNEQQFKRHLYEAAMVKIKELTSKGLDGGHDPEQKNEELKQQQNNFQPNNTPPASNQQQNPLIQQEQQPMYMALSIEDINKIVDPGVRTIMLSMHADNRRLRAESEANARVVNSLRDGKLAEAAALRAQRVAILGRLSPRVKADLDGMLTSPGMALSMGDGGNVVDPMGPTLSILERGLSDIPRLLTQDALLSLAQPHPTDQDRLSDADAEALTESLARMMGCPPERKAS